MESDQGEDPRFAELIEEFGLTGDGWIDALRRAEASARSRSLGPYVEAREVGGGGQGVVYRARDAESGEWVAIKRLKDGGGTVEGRTRLAREVEAMKRLDHPGIVGVRGTAEIEGETVLVMDWVDGVAIDRHEYLIGLPPEQFLGHSISQFV